MNRIVDYWPVADYKPRKNQLLAFDWMEENPDAKYYFLQAPVGAGKSLIGTTFANYLKAISQRERASFVLTPQRILQEQYEKSFPRHMLASLYGKSNYPCSKIDSTCDVGSALPGNCASCPYAGARNRAQGTDHVVLNYKIALLMFLYTQVWETRPLVVLDECHTAETYLTELDAVAITSNRADKYDVKWKTFDDINKALNWVEKDYLPKATDYFDDLYNELINIIEYNEQPDAKAIPKLKELNGLHEHLDAIRELVLYPEDTIKNEYVLVKDKITMRFKRLRAGPTFHKIVEPYGDKFLFMSSTILNYKGFCQDLDIDPDQAVYLDLQSEFPAENRPVFYMPQMKMNASWKQPENENKRSVMLSTIQQIIKMHENDSGIIHTGNFQIAEWLVENLEGKISQDIWHHNPTSNTDRNAVINAFQRSERPGVLISPSITEGLDLKDDLARFAIFAKVPFGYLGDQWIKRRMEMSQEWYQRRALIDIIQGGGRVVRTPDDQGYVYILDQSWGYLYYNTAGFIPEWWKEAYLVQR